MMSYHMKIGAEEAYLQRAHGAEHEAHCTRAGRYLPRVWLAEKE